MICLWTTKYLVMRKMLLFNILYNIPKEVMKSKTCAVPYYRNTVFPRPSNCGTAWLSPSLYTCFSLLIFLLKDFKSKRTLQQLNYMLDACRATIGDRNEWMKLLFIIYSFFCFSILPHSVGIYNLNFQKVWYCNTFNDHFAWFCGPYTGTVKMLKLSVWRHKCGKNMSKLSTSYT
jgi:hypothetical protein